MKHAFRVAVSSLVLIAAAEYRALTLSGDRYRARFFAILGWGFPLLPALFSLYKLNVSVDYNYIGLKDSEIFVIFLLFVGFVCWMGSFIFDGGDVG